VSDVGFDHVRGLWEEGERRLRTDAEADRPALERVVSAIVDELRRRMGASFTANELADYYLLEGTDWCFQIAMRVAPDQPEAWEMATVCGAAFARYLRAASDFGGGRRIFRDDSE
jgi:hypothetical protein